MPRSSPTSDQLAAALECVICKESFVADDVGVTLPCSDMHMFHDDCISQWLRQCSHTCPVCRFALPQREEPLNSPSQSPLFAPRMSTAPSRNAMVVTVNFQPGAPLNRESMLGDMQDRIFSALSQMHAPNERSEQTATQSAQSTITDSDTPSSDNAAGAKRDRGPNDEDNNPRRSRRRR